MRALLVSFAIVGLLALSGCDPNPTGPTADPGAATTAGGGTPTIPKAERTPETPTKKGQRAPEGLEPTAPN